MRYLPLRVLAIAFFAMGLYCRTTYAAPLDVTSFRTCISALGSSYGNTCELQAGTSPIASELVVGRPGITLLGNTGTGGRSTIKRDRSAGAGPKTLLRIDSSVTNIYVHDIDFDGDYGAPLATCSITDSQCDRKWPGTCVPTDARSGCGEWSDVVIDKTASYVHFYSDNFKNATENAITAEGIGHTFYLITITNGRNCGIHIGNGTAISVTSSTFTGNYGAGICLAGGVKSNITIGSAGVGNSFYHNHWGKSDGSDGGQVYVGSSSYTTVASNLINGQYSGDPGHNTGIEVDPGVSNLVIKDNTVTNHGAEGENFKWDVTATVTNDTISSNGLALAVPGDYGIKVLGVLDQQRFSDVVPSSPYRPTSSRMADAGITAGCGTGSTFCPNDTLTRRQMAIFIIRAIYWRKTPKRGQRIRGEGYEVGQRQAAGDVFNVRVQPPIFVHHQNGWQRACGIGGAGHIALDRAVAVGRRDG